MNEFSKLILGTALVAAGFGLATMLGPPEAVWSSPSNRLTNRGTRSPRSSAQPLQLRAEDGHPQIANSPRSSLRRPPQWLAPIQMEEPSILLGADRPASSPINLATAEFPVAKQERPVTTAQTDMQNELRNASNAATRPNNSARFFPADPIEWPKNATTVTFSTAGFGAQPTKPDSSEEMQPSELTEQRTHVISDGDTLPKLAKLYLDDPAREWEIFQLNKELLHNPGLLPIGKILKIPDRVPKEPAPIAETSQAPPTAPITTVSQPKPAVDEPDDESQNKGVPDLVPVKPIRAASAIPQALLLRPVPLQSSP